MARLGPRHSTDDDTSGKSAKEKAAARQKRTDTAAAAKVREGQRRASGRASNPPA